MAKERMEGWTRSTSFQKHYATAFGIDGTKDTYRIDVANERIELSPTEHVFVSECQIIMNEETFDALLELMKKVKRQRRKAVKNGKSGE